MRNKTMRLTIGDVRTWSLGAAQDEATRLKTLTDQGIDPRQLRAEQNAAADALRLRKQNEAILVAEVWGA